MSEDRREIKRNNACRPMKRYTLHLDYYSSFLESIRAVDASPRMDPKVWLAAKRYPVAEPSPKGYTTSDEYDIKTEVIGMKKNPTQAPIISNSQSALGFLIRIIWRRININKHRSRPRLMKVITYENDLFVLKSLFYSDGEEKRAYDSW